MKLVDLRGFSCELESKMSSVAENTRRYTGNKTRGHNTYFSENQGEWGK